MRWPFYRGGALESTWTSPARADLERLASGGSRWQLWHPASEQIRSEISNHDRGNRRLSRRFLWISDPDQWNSLSFTLNRVW